MSAATQNITDTPTRVLNTTPQITYSPGITTVSNNLYNWTSWTTQHALSADQLPIITTINIRQHYILQQHRDHLQTTKKNGHISFSFRPQYPPTYIILMADKHNIPKSKTHNNYRFLPSNGMHNHTKKQHEESRYL